MSRAFFAVLPRSSALAKLMDALHRLGISAHNVSTLSFESSPSEESASPEPRRAPVINATGQLRWAIQGASSTGATRRISRALAGMGVPEPAARRYQELVLGGNTLLCVFCDDAAQGKQAASVLQRFRVRELASTGAPGQSEHALNEYSKSH